MLPPLSISRRMTGAGLIPPPIETQNVSRWKRGSSCVGPRHSAVLLAWDAGSLSTRKFCHGNKRCQPALPAPSGLRAGACFASPRVGANLYRPASD
jgi:hypothetical protein